MNQKLLKTMKNIASLIFVLTWSTSCNLPKDPEGSWTSIQATELVVGMVNTSEHSTKNQIIQKEKLLVQNFASANDLKIRCIDGSESQLLEALQAYDIHIMIGGFDKKSVLKKEVGMTTAYDGTHVLFIPKGENELLFHVESYINKSK